MFPRINATNMKMQDIFKSIEKIKNTASIIEIKAVNPDISIKHYNGEKINIASRKYIYRSYKTWFDLSEIFKFKFLTPVLCDDFVKIQYQVLHQNSLHKEINTSNKQEKYGADSEFFRINKLEEPFFWDNYSDALKRAELDLDAKILSLGVNRGDEFYPILKEYQDKVSTFSFVGIDHSLTALETARINFGNYKSKFICEDINFLKNILTSKFNLIIAIGLLQSPGISGNQLIRDLVQNYSEDKVTFILGFPNSRYIDKEIIYGAKMKNFKKPDMSLLLKDILFYKKYFQQHKFKVNITGKYYLFLTAIR